MAYGDISTVLGSQSIPNFHDVEIVHLDGDYVAVVGYNFSTKAGYIYTYAIDNEGNITGTAVDSWNFASYATSPYITKLSGDKYLLGYEPSSSGDGVVKSLTISNTGTITKSFIDTLTMPSGYRLLHGQLFVTGDSNNTCLAHCYGGKIVSFTADSSGNISDNAVDTYAPGGGTFAANIINISSNYYATVYWDEIITFSIDGSSNITAVDSWDWTSEGGKYSNICKIPNSTKCAIVYRNDASKGKIITVNISSAGVITESIIDTLIFNDNLVYNLLITYYADNLFAVNYIQTGGDGKTTTFACSSNGVLSDSIEDTATWYDSSATGELASTHGTINAQDDIHVNVFSTMDYEGQIISFSADDTYVPPPNPGGDINWARCRIQG